MTTTTTTANDTWLEHGRHRHATVPAVDPHQAVHHHVLGHKRVALREAETAQQSVLRVGGMENERKR
jgi:hypothetical protein